MCEAEGCSTAREVNTGEHNLGDIFGNASESPSQRTAKRSAVKGVWGCDDSPENGMEMGYT